MEINTKMVSFNKCNTFTVNELKEQIALRSVAMYKAECNVRTNMRREIVMLENLCKVLEGSK